MARNNTSSNDFETEEVVEEDNFSTNSYEQNYSNNQEPINYSGNMMAYEEQEEQNYNVVYDDNEPQKRSFLTVVLDFYYAHKLIVLLLLFIILLLVILLLVNGCSKKNGNLNNMTINVPDIVYLDEENNMTVTALGKGNLKSTNFEFNIVDDKIASTSENKLIGNFVNNKIKGLSSGKTKIVVKAVLGSKVLNDEKDVLVCKRLNDSNVNTSNVNLSVGQTFNLNNNLSLGVSECFENVFYELDNTNSLELNGNTVIAKNSGVTMVTAKFGNDNVQYKITVSSSKNEGITFDVSNVSLSKGGSKKINVTFNPKSIADKGVVWKSSNESVATVNDGVIKAVGNGNAVITLTTTDGAYSAKVNVNVSDAPAKKTVAKPTSKLCVSRTYSGKEQQLISSTSATGYTLSGYKGTKAGYHTITAKLASGYVWSDGTSNDVTFRCNIAKAKNEFKVKIVGNSTVGNSLSLNIDNNQKSSYTYQWYLVSTSGTKVKIAGANSSTLKITDSYLGNFISVTVTSLESDNYLKYSANATTSNVVTK